MEYNPDLPQAEPADLIAALSLPGMGSISLRRVLERFGSWQAARAADIDELRECGLRSETARALRDGRFQIDPQAEMDKARELGVQIIAFCDAAFPPALAHETGGPLLLYVKGDILERDALAVALVGARRASLYGKMHAERLGYELAQAGFTVVSGLAQGIDTAAHGGALKGGGRTLAVLGNGLASVYPPENAALAERVAAQGALISELPLDAPPAAANFPPRNRIIAGLSLGVVVIEAARTSGALITARLAGEMGREVFAMPGDIGRPQTRGPHRLLRDGAHLVETVEDIIDALGPLDRPLRVSESAEMLTDPRALVLNHQERQIFDLLDSTPKDIDVITREARLSAANVASTLMVLELRRMAVQLPGKLYVRAGTLQR